MTAGMLLR